MPKNHALIHGIFNRKSPKIMDKKLEQKLTSIQFSIFYVLKQQLFDGFCVPTLTVGSHNIRKTTGTSSHSC